VQSYDALQRWMKKLNYWWGKKPSGQYVDGHERDDVVTYWQSVFLPWWDRVEPHMAYWEKAEDGGMVERKPAGRKIVAWIHDELIFYANDRQNTGWVHETESAKPKPKGERASLMVADFVSADYGWLRSPDGRESTCVLFKPGKMRDGYFDAKDIIQQAKQAVNILLTHYPHDFHILVYDNATTHQKRPDDGLSAIKIPKFPKDWGVETTVLDVKGKLVFGPDGKKVKKVIPMRAGYFNGQRQPFYFPEDHDLSGKFKGMQQILIERGLVEEAHLNAQCKSFRCPKDAVACCCRCVLYNQPDFAMAESMLEETCRLLGIPVMFWPKFHCELSMIESCWGATKRFY
jgi:hypothetical protein